MNNKILAATLTTVVGLAGIGVVVNLKADRDYVELEGDSILHGADPVDALPEDSIPLALIKDRIVKIRPLMGTGATDAVKASVTTWLVTLDDGTTLKLEPQSVMLFPEGTDLDTMRRQAWGDKYEEYYGN